MHNDFVHDHVAWWPMQEGWELSRADVVRWIQTWVHSTEGQERLANALSDLRRQKQWDQEDDEMWEHELAHEDAAWAAEYRRRRGLVRLLGQEPEDELGRLLMDVDDEGTPPPNWRDVVWLHEL
jgi:hypothetical protein